MNIDRDWIALSGIIVLFQAVTAVTVILLNWCSRDGWLLVSSCEPRRKAICRGRAGARGAIQGRIKYC